MTLSNSKDFELDVAEYVEEALERCGDKDHEYAIQRLTKPDQTKARNDRTAQQQTDWIDPVYDRAGKESQNEHQSGRIDQNKNRVWQQVLQKLGHPGIDAKFHITNQTVHHEEQEKWQ